MKTFNALSQTERKELQAIKSIASKRYLGLGPAIAMGVSSLRASSTTSPNENVVGVGIDEKYVEGVPTGASVLKFLVKKKFAKSAIPAAQMLPTSLDGVETDVEEVGEIIPQAKKKKAAPATTAAMSNPKSRIRPAQPGSSVGFVEPTNAFVMAGTLGLLVKDTVGKVYILSNNHVIAYENGIDATGAKRVALKPGDPIYQPGLLDGGTVPKDKIAVLTRWIDLRADRTDNHVDAAIAEVQQKTAAIKDILYIGAPTGVANAQPDMLVHKFGRTTSYRAGRISSVTFDVKIAYEVGTVAFEDQIAIRGLAGQRFSDSGDSGSAILERTTNAVVGLLFAGATNGSLTFANHIGDVFRKLKIRLA